MSKLTLSEYNSWTKISLSKSEMSKWKFGLTVKICPIVLEDFLFPQIGQIGQIFTVGQIGQIFTGKFFSIWTWSFASRSY